MDVTKCLPFLALLSVCAHACLWDSNDKRLYCAWDEPQPKESWVIPCVPKTVPMRSAQGRVYCGTMDDLLGLAPSIKLQRTEKCKPGEMVLEGDMYQCAGATPAEMSLDCEVVKDQPKCWPVKTYSECNAGLITSSAATDGMLCCDPKGNGHMQLKCKIVEDKH